MQSIHRSIALAALFGTAMPGCSAAPDSDIGTGSKQSESLSIVSCPIFAQCFVVTNINNSGPGSLRQAILDANAVASGARIIKFDIPGPGPHVIQPVQYLPMLLGDTTIDGFSEPDTARATADSAPEIEIVLNGLFSTGNFGLNLGVGRNVIQGLAINDFPGSGIVISSSDNIVRGNMLGVDRDATFARPNAQAGVNINVGSGNLIGGPNIADRNVLSGNGVEGARIYSAANFVYGNAIGTNFDGTAGIGNGGSGIWLYGEGQNEIGGTGEGEANLIGHNGGDGITVAAGEENTFSRNLIFANGELGIDLGADGVTRNDGLLDPDTGPNELQNFPHLDSATLDPATLADGRYKVEVSWHLKSKARTKFRVEFFASGGCDGSGRGEAERFLGSRAIDTDATGLAENVWVLPGRVTPGEVITATATEFVRIGTDYVATDTSELGKCLLADFCAGGTCSAVDDGE
jgi:hypothetical protein